MEETVLQINVYKVVLGHIENRYDNIHNYINKNTDMERLGRQYCLLYLVYRI
ncbi:hypothetical protein WN55_00126 [Dufourea novaeangliae]|uniref:Uncharacterized protein n=1 Tax=Dufourea novaeangliae TaxID=178035 RepID=A0A154PDI9_DUFNO|nr:hypothetical protein WN55_00126 [Dufourea novaeangliae]